MKLRIKTIILTFVIAGTAPMLAQAEGDARRGAKSYRVCSACHSLEASVHLTGPSIANLWGKNAGTIVGFDRYSKALKTADIVWDNHTLVASFADPWTLAPGTDLPINLTGEFG